MATTAKSAPHKPGRSNLAVSVGSASNSEQASKIPDLLDLSVDEIFEKYLVPQVQRLHGAYKSSVSTARVELHKLVGSKYRDLLRIAEDIDGMSSMSVTINQDLTTMAYRKSAATPFGKTNRLKFATFMRAGLATKSRKDSEKTILNNVINNQLIGHDLQIRTGEVESTAELVDLAVVYHTVTTTLKSSMQDKGNTAFVRLRTNFINYLESKIASFGTSGAGLGPDDDDTLSEPFDLDEENDSIRYKMASLFVNYLTAYILVSPEIASMELICKRYLSLRFNYLSAHLDLTSPAYFRVFKYIELTFYHVHKLFVEGPIHVSDLSNALTLRPWRASDRIGFHHWFEDDHVSFDLKGFAALKASTVSHQLLEFSKLVIFEFIAPLESGPSKQIQIQLLALHDFTVGLKKIETQALNNHDKCFTSELVCHSGVAEKYLESVLGSAREVFGEHIKALLVRFANLDLAENTEPRIDLFSLEFIGLVDTDLDAYLSNVALVTGIDDHTSDSKTSAVTELGRWFHELKNLNAELVPRQDNLLQTTITALQQQSRGTEIAELNWGSFTDKAVTDAFEKLREEFSDSSTQFCKSLVESLSGKSNPESGLVALHLFLLARENTDEESLHQIIDAEVRKIYETLFDAVTVPEFTTDYKPHDLTRPSIELHSELFDVCRGLLTSDLYSEHELASVFVRESARNIFVDVKNAYLEKVLSRLILKEAEASPEVEVGPAENTGHEAATEETKDTSERESLEFDNDGWGDDDVEFAEGETEQLEKTHEADEVSLEKAHEAEEVMLEEERAPPTSNGRPHHSDIVADVVFIMNLMSPSTTAERVAALLHIPELEIEPVFRSTKEFLKSSRNIFIPLLVA